MAQNYFESQYPHVWERAIEYTLEVAKAMPEENYNFKPEAEAMTFGGQMLHIVDNISFLTKLVSGNTITFYDRSKSEELSKSQILDILTNANAYVGKLIAEISENDRNAAIEFRNVEMSKENIFYLLRDHQVHHRGQCIIYLRIAGVKAPPYVGW
ncbi:DinB family protein [Belliella sp. DSM 107340]|uniref:DinB family protein n=1 Tax=Belliella calami TaxID=2923436 RepID=A0ABS9UIN1_9BACT|nr:DinB family protein [Belliella calami]MCH7396464.1 DinB family protein [Belliella calami]